MDTAKKPWPIVTVFGIRERIDTNPDYQRPPVWTRGQKQLLVDTILRNYDIPKFYWRKTGIKPDTYDVVDGQQRLRAIWEFVEGKFKLPKDAIPIDDYDVANAAYPDLPDELRIRFDTYSLDVVLVEGADEDEVREMFLRLQNGTSLRSQEKRNAYPGRMRDFARELSGHPFFKSVGFSNSRFTHDLVAAQLVCLELAGGPTNVKDRDLNKMYRSHQDIDDHGPEAKAVRRVLDLLVGAFPEQAPELTRFNVIALYCVAAELLASYVRSEFAPLLAPWFLDFESRRMAQDTLSEDEADPDWIGYKEKISHSTDSEDSIRARMDFMLRDLLVCQPGLSLKDAQRTFTPQQRMAVFRRDGGVCRVAVKCDGAKVRWDDWHCDHRTAWTEGGKTTVENGQVACAACNFAKGKRAQAV
jgi:hypothetical protein